MESSWKRGRRKRFSLHTCNVKSGLLVLAQVDASVSHREGCLKKGETIARLNMSPLFKQEGEREGTERKGGKDPTQHSY